MIIVHHSPDEAVRRKCIELEKVRKEESKAMHKALLKRTILTDPWFMFRVCFEWGMLDEDLVGHKYIKHMADNWGEDTGILFPRGHGKTVPTGGMAVHAILNNPNIAILEISRTEDQAKKIGKSVSDHLVYNDMLQECFGRGYNPKDGFLPSKISDCSQWGNDGYSLPWRKNRIDPTLLFIPLAAAKAGKHPDIIWVDDPTEMENNDERGWQHVISVIQSCTFLLPASGRFWWTGTRWSDADPLGMAEKGKLRGKRGPFRFIAESCYVDDMPEKGPTYPEKFRWNMDEVTGNSMESLAASAASLGSFFDCQMRNNPSPADRAIIRVADINIYKPEDVPTYGEVRTMGIETVGGGLLVFNGFKEYLDELKITVPLDLISTPRKHGVEKSDRITSALQPIIESGRLFAQAWMIGEPNSDEGLGYEIRRIGKAQHDDIIDALHSVVVHLTKGMVPPNPDSEADLYISVDCAYTEKSRSDHTVAIAVAVDHKGNHWIVDYDRFQIASPTGIYQRLLAFYQKFAKQKRRTFNNNKKKFTGAWK